MSWCFKNSKDLPKFNISRVDEGDKGLYHCCEHLAEGCCSQVVNNPPPDDGVKVNLNVIAASELMCSQNSCVVEINRGETNILLKGELQRYPHNAPTSVPFEKLHSGMWSCHHPNKTSTELYTNVSLTKMGDRNTTLELNGSVENLDSATFVLSADPIRTQEHGTSSIFCYNSISLTHTIRFTISIVDPSTSLSPSTTSEEAPAPSADNIVTDTPSVDIALHVATPIVVVVVVLAVVIFGLILIVVICRCQKRSGARSPIISKENGGTFCEEEFYVSVGRKGYVAHTTTSPSPTTTTVTERTETCSAQECSVNEEDVSEDLFPDIEQDEPQNL